jgi:hypothetical protein
MWKKHGGRYESRMKELRALGLLPIFEVLETTYDPSREEWHIRDMRRRGYEGTRSPICRCPRIPELESEEASRICAARDRSRGGRGSPGVMQRRRENSCNQMGRAQMIRIKAQPSPELPIWISCPFVLWLVLLTFLTFFLTMDYVKSNRIAVNAGRNKVNPHALGFGTETSCSRCHPDRL